ncbi:MAG: potassium transporter Kup [Geminicoccaceae bacterium]
MSAAASLTHGDAETAAAHAKSSFWSLTLGSVGVVYGDIGTSPLYAFREALVHTAGDGVTRAEVLGVASLLLWALIFIVTCKYVVFLMRADNHGEGGTLSLLALAQHALGRRTMVVFLLGVAGAALFYGDAIITPAISVLSAVEGLKLVTPVFEPYIIPITLGILVVLFAAQRFGTGRVAAFFGPVMLVWFVVLAVLGLRHIGDDPGILAAFNPVHAVSLFFSHGIVGFLVLGSVFLAVTGAEALYADMGHFGRGPIQLAWIAIVFPSLALNYLGQGALILKDPGTLENPFFLMGPAWAILPFVVLAAIATVIASQAVITGAYSMTQQAIQLGLLPRLEIQHTSETQFGQIFMPDVNRLLLVGVLLLVLLFKTSTALASAYGIAVTGTMIVTTLLSLAVVWKGWHWPLPLTIALIAPFAVVDTIFLAANLFKLFDGGYVPLLLATGMILLMWTWSRGTRLLLEKIHKDSLPIDQLIEILERKPPIRVPNTAVYLTSDPNVTPSALLHNLKHNMVLHEKNIILNVRVTDVPRVVDAERVTIEDMPFGFKRMIVKCGFMETPNIPHALVIARRQGLRFDIMKTSFFLGRRSLKPAIRSAMPAWQDNLYIGMAKQAANVTDFFAIPSGRVVELGTQVTV